MARILVVDPDATRSKVLTHVLARDGHTHRQVAAAPDALAALDADLYDLVVLAAASAPEVSDFFERLGARRSGLPVITIAGADPSNNASEALRVGAADSLTTPLVPEEVSFVVSKALSAAARMSEKPPRAEARTSALLGETEPMRTLRELLGKVANSASTTLVRGETGTGKELVARAVHALSPRQDRPFVKIDCASLPDNLLESELFGYERGAFTGAVARKPGRVELAEGGTLFLDEIGEISLPLQAKLLRLLQDREFERLGGRGTQRIDVRFVLATHRDLETMVENGFFRADLFHRLNVVTLWLPPLRARRDDIPLLAREFARALALAGRKPVREFEPDALRLLRAQRWTGNVRQLEHFVERLVVFSDGATIGAADVARELVPKPRFRTQQTESRDADERVVEPLALATAVRRAEHTALLAALERSEGNRSIAARLLGVSRATLYNKLREYEIE